MNVSALHAACLLLFTAALLCSSPASAAELDSCTAIAGDLDRLACYDRIAGRNPPGPQQRPAVVQPDTSQPADLSPLSQRWELDERAKVGTFAIRGYRPTYLLPAYYTDNPNVTPAAAGRVAPERGLNHTEAKFQLSFKTKLLEKILFERSDLWFGYTQQSYWQVYNRQRSSPFRETNYEPELMLVTPTDYNVFGLRARLLNLGIVHQSNGQSDPRSRSWNRVYAQLGFERGNFTLFIRPWWRISEAAKDDDNPGITDYIGRGEILAHYRLGEDLFSLQVRNNFRSQNRGSAQFDWTFPLAGSLRGYLQFFSGYGESLIDYNHRQNAVGAGVMLVDWL